MLYVFAGFPKCNLNAGGLQYCIEEVEELGLLEHDPAIQYRKEGVFASDTDEWLYAIDYSLSPMLERDGITWDWFTENWHFGNGVNVFKHLAFYDYKTVISGTNLDLDEYLAEFGSANIGDLTFERKRITDQGWDEYEARFLPGKCPTASHVVHLTWLITTHKLPDFAYERIRSLIEDGAIPEQSELYVYPDEPNKYLATPYLLKEEHHAVPQHS